MSLEESSLSYMLFNQLLCLDTKYIINLNRFRKHTHGVGGYDSIWMNGKSDIM